MVEKLTLIFSYEGSSTKHRISVPASEGAGSSIQLADRMLHENR